MDKFRLLIIIVPIFFFLLSPREHLILVDLILVSKFLKLKGLSIEFSDIIHLRKALDVVNHVVQLLILGGIAIVRDNGHTIVKLEGK